MEKSCDSCKWCLKIDHDYSNYAVEGTDAYCIKDLHPVKEYDTWYGKAKEAQHAEKCEGHSHGDPVDVDCDREEGKIIDYISDIEVQLYVSIDPESITQHDW